MSEIPERKVLRTVLTKLKKKTISSRNRFKHSTKRMEDSFNKTIETMTSDLDKEKTWLKK